VPGRPALVGPTGLTGLCRWSSRRHNFSIRTPNWVIQVSILIISMSSSIWYCQICYLRNFCTMSKCLGVYWWVPNAMVLSWEWFVEVPGRPALSRPCRWSSRRRNFSVRTPNWVIQVSILIILMSSSTSCCQICDLKNFCTISKCHLYRDVWLNLHLYGLNCYFTNNGICAPFYLYSLRNMVGHKTRGTY